MKQWFLLGVVLASAAAMADTDPLVGCPGAQQWVERNAPAHKAEGPEAAVPKDPERRQLLLDMARRDQDMRGVLTTGKAPTRKQREQMVAVDKHNTAVLRSWLEAGRLPVASDVGVDGMSALWLLAQHADAEPSLQEEVLAYYGGMPDFGGIPGRNYAMLVDRVLRAQGKPQRYGSQFSQAGANSPMEMQPVEDMQKLDALRAEVGLMPIDDYRCVMNNMRVH